MNLFAAPLPPTDAEWLEADGLGGFASGTVSGIRARRYHALLLVATAPPAGRMVLVNGFDAWIETPNETFAISAQRYWPDVLSPDDTPTLAAFSSRPWPCWTFRFGEHEVRQEIFVSPGTAAALVCWTLVSSSSTSVRLGVRPFFSGRDFHSLHYQNDAFRFESEQTPEALIWHPYDGVPAIAVKSNGRYVHAPHWYQSFLYAEDKARGLDCTEDLAAPGVFWFELKANDRAEMAFATEARALDESWESLSERESVRRAAFPSALHQSADSYLVRRGAGHTIIAGYPWFGDWGRDTFIAMRGLCFTTGRLDVARGILIEWAGVVSEGMLPNRFPDRGETPEFDSADASLWFFIAAHEYLQTDAATAQDHATLQRAMEFILEGYGTGTRYGIRLDNDGLLSCGVPGVQLTWMDAKVGDEVVTQRMGKPVEVQTLWLNALAIAASFSARWALVWDLGRASFEERFWNEEAGALYDVVDADHIAGSNDASLRPNQIFAVGGLPFSLIKGERARRIVDTVERELLTPMGLRTLAPGSPGYCPHYEGDVWHRDHAYHQGTVWPWLMGAFVEAWLSVHGNSPVTREEARLRFLTPLREHLRVAGLGHVSEIANAVPPHTPRGCPFQAWSLGEFLRIEHLLA